MSMESERQTLVLPPYVAPTFIAVQGPPPNQPSAVILPAAAAAANPNPTAALSSLNTAIGNLNISPVNQTTHLNTVYHHPMGRSAGLGGVRPPNIGVHHYPHAPDLVTYSQYVHGSIFSVPKSWPKENNDDLVVSVYGFVKSFIGASGTNQGAIDNRIEQAMDLVKSHLMSAVRGEVEELKEKIQSLEDQISCLQNENEILRANVPQDVLLQITTNQPAMITGGNPVPALTNNMSSSTASTTTSVTSGVISACSDTSAPTSNPPNPPPAASTPSAAPTQAVPTAATQGQQAQQGSVADGNHATQSSSSSSLSHAPQLQPTS